MNDDFFHRELAKAEALIAEARGPVHGFMSRHAEAFAVCALLAGLLIGIKIGGLL